MKINFGKLKKYISLFCLKFDLISPLKIFAVISDTPCIKQSLVCFKFGTWYLVAIGAIRTLVGTSDNFADVFALCLLVNKLKYFDNFMSLLDNKFVFPANRNYWKSLLEKIAAKPCNDYVNKIIWKTTSGKCN